MMKKKDQLLKKPVTINRKLPKQSRQTPKKHGGIKVLNLLLYRLAKLQISLLTRSPKFTPTSLKEQLY